MEIYAMPGHLIRRLNQISTALFMERMGEAGLTLTPVQFAALAALRENPDIDQATVAGLVAYDRATLGKVIDRLESRGLVRRSTSQSDRRAKVLTLTDAGIGLYENALPHVQAIQSEMLAGLDEDERDTLVRLLDKATMAANERSRAPLKRRG
ncbi:MarR family winged helix-turn-helix transcriptional regulator [Arenibacterium sp. CAU 1754]